MLEQSITSSGVPTSASLYLVSAMGNGQPSQFSVPQCATSLGFPRFPHPSKVDDDNSRPSINGTQKLQPRINPISRRSRHFVPNERKDEYYWQKRKKNNEAARKSREKRRTFDSVLEEKVMLLSHENKLLRSELYALKLKHGEITADSNSDPMDALLDDKVSLSAVSNPTSHFNQTVENESKSNGVSSPSSLTVPANITLPQVSVILEKNSSSADAVTSAKLVLSSLASGTLILSPVNLSCRDKPLGNASVLDAKKPDEVYSNTEMKTVEAANTLATLFQTNGVGGDASHKQPELKHDSTDSASPESHSSLEDASGVSKKQQCLPHKLRFKCAKFE